MRGLLLRRPVLSWALYDWANSAFATAVMAGFFPVFFKRYWAEGVAGDESTFLLGLGNSTAALIVALAAPVLGSIADRGGARKRSLLTFAGLGAAACAGLFFVGQGQWGAALAVYVLGHVGFTLSVVFSDSLLVDVAPRERYDMVSAAGFAAGYLGGGLLFAGALVMVVRPDLFGLSDAGAAVRWAFVATAVWWAVFSVPLALYVRERETVDRQAGWASVRAGLAQLAATARHIGRLRHVALFLLGFWLYIDGVNTIIKMAVDYGVALGFADTHLLLALLVVQLVGFPAALAFGYLGERIGTRRGIYVGIAVYVLVTLYASRLDQVWEFYVLAVAIGLVQGGVQSLSRSFYARLIPADKTGEFFGFYNTVGRFAAVFGPLLVGTVTMLTGNHRAGILMIPLLFIGGVILLALVREPPAPAAA